VVPFHSLVVMEQASGTLVRAAPTTPSASGGATGHPPDIDFDFNRDVVCLFGLVFDRVTLDQTVDRLLNATENRQRCHLVTPNVNLLRLSRGDQAFRAALLASDLSVVDGMPLVWLARLLEEGIPERVSGADIFAALGNQPRPTRVFFFGGEEEVAGRLKRSLGGHTTGLQCVGTMAPGFGPLETLCDSSRIRTINSVQPDLVLVAVGARKGVLWIGRNEAVLTAPIIANLGATIHFAAGTIKRAPVRWRNSGFEWLWRIGQEPHLATRYLADLGTLASVTLRYVLPQLASRWIFDRMRNNKDKCYVQIRLEPDGEGKRLRLTGRFRRGHLQPLREALASACCNPGDLVIDLDEVTFMDASAAGLLLLAHGHQYRRGLKFSVRATGWRTRMILGIYGCGFLLTSTRDDRMRGSVGKPRQKAALVGLPGIRR
jgi:N-acetylglucosaminyldiphosphoundecaprenol N-acetyl-beta-D-mannosaminyltransferase